jgi:hypothetical protein
MPGGGGGGIIRRFGTQRPDGARCQPGPHPPETFGSCCSPKASLFATAKCFRRGNAKTSPTHSDGCRKPTN